MTNDSQPSSRRYRWPWILLAAVLLGILLTVLWVLGAVKRVKQIKGSTQQAALSLPVQREPRVRAF